MTVRYVKLNGRHKASNLFQYRVELFKPEAVKISTFAAFLKWSADTWGMSVPVDMYRTRYEFERNKHWAWNGGNNDWLNMHLYLCGDSELALFKLKWM